MIHLIQKKDYTKKADLIFTNISEIFVQSIELFPFSCSINSWLDKALWKKITLTEIIYILTVNHQAFFLLYEVLHEQYLYHV